jgi:hypothetical protein
VGEDAAGALGEHVGDAGELGAAAGSSSLEPVPEEGSGLSLVA